MPLKIKGKSQQSLKTEILQKEPKTMADLLASQGIKVRGFKAGDKVKGTIMAITPKSVMIDIGGKTEGVVTEKALGEARDFVSTLKVGDEIEASVLIPETPEGYTVLSLRQASSDSSWQTLTEAKEKKEEVIVLGRAINPAGITVDIGGLNGFIPGSQLGRETSKNKESLIGRYFKAVPIEIDRSTSKVVLSEKEVSEREDIKVQKEALSKIVEGDIYDGEVTSVTNFGCFVKINLGTPKKPTFIEGLVHISELSWDKIVTPSDVIKEGEKKKVRVIGVRDGKLALSIKAAQADPWEKAEGKYKKEQRVKGKVTRISDFGVFIELEPGIEGLVHLTKIPPGVKFVEGQEVDCYVQDLDTKSKKMSLGLVLTTKPVGYK